MMRAVCVISNSTAIAKVSSVWHRAAKEDWTPSLCSCKLFCWVYSGLQSMCETVSPVVSSSGGGSGMS